MTGLMGVAISTTGDEHRLDFLSASVEAWRKALPWGAVLVVTVDGDEAHAQAASRVVGQTTVIRVGQPADPVARQYAPEVRGSRMGVAVNKNTGIEYLMDAGVEHLFLCDDDTWPTTRAAMYDHIDAPLPHSMVCWGRHRLLTIDRRDGMRYSKWTWPRGVMLYTHRDVIDQVGGMDEDFGPGGHEHVEWSRRIHQAGLTPAPFVAPLSNAGPYGMEARLLWHAEDMPRRGEGMSQTRRRRASITSVNRLPGDWEKIEALMAQRDGDTSVVPYRAHANSRLSATLIQNNPRQGAEESK